jgi:hypothetical protein
MSRAAKQAARGRSGQALKRRAFQALLEVFHSTRDAAVTHSPEAERALDFTSRTDGTAFAITTIGFLQG